MSTEIISHLEHVSTNQITVPYKDKSDSQKSPQIIADISSVTHQFPGFSLRVCSSLSQSHEMEKILVQWSDGRWKGTTSFVKKSAVKKGTTAVEEKVGVIWGKSKKTYNAQVLDICS